VGGWARESGSEHKGDNALVEDPVVLGQDFDYVRAGAGQLVVDLGRRREEGLAAVCGRVERVHRKDVAQVCVEGLRHGRISKVESKVYFPVSRGLWQ
jgi:hypothetical protein